MIIILNLKVPVKVTVILNFIKCDLCSSEIWDFRVIVLFPILTFSVTIIKIFFNINIPI